MARPTIHKDGTPLTPYERVKRCRDKKRAEREERIHDACAATAWEEMERERKAALWAAFHAQPVHDRPYPKWDGKQPTQPEGDK